MESGGVESHPPWPLVEWCMVRAMRWTTNRRPIGENDALTWIADNRDCQCHMGNDLCSLLMLQVLNWEISFFDVATYYYPKSLVNPIIGIKSSIADCSIGLSLKNKGLLKKIWKNKGSIWLWYFLSKFLENSLQLTFEHLIFESALLWILFFIIIYILYVVCLQA
mgnify:CR=1 FL=1